MSYNTSQRHSSDIPEAFPPVVQPTMSLDEFWDKHVTHLPAKDTCRHVRISSGKSPPPPPPHGLVETPHGVRPQHASPHAPTNHSPHTASSNNTAHTACIASPANDSLRSFDHDSGRHSSACDEAHPSNGTMRRDSVTRRIINHSPPHDYSDPSVLSDTEHVHAGDARVTRNPVMHGSFRPAMNRASSSSDSSFFTTEPLTINELS